MHSAWPTKYLSVACACALISCGQDDSNQRSGAGTNLPEAGSTVPGLHRDGNQLTLQTDQFTLQPGQEKYMCWTAKASEAVKVASFSKDAQPFVHHVVLVTTTEDEPDGMRECDGLFRLKWRPLFAAGAGKVELAFPDDVVSAIDQNTQLLVQLHLLNQSDQPVTDSAAIVMKLSDAPVTENVMIGAFGNTDINLPPGQPGQVVVDCQNPIGTRLVGFFPHMHMLGRAMTFELGPTPDDMHMVYERTPYEFGDQRIDSTDMMLDGNSQVRVTCNYENKTQQAVTYGESTHDEMCWLVMFLVGRPTGCVLGSGPIFGDGG